MITCDIFVFATILEYCVAQLLDRLDRDWATENVVGNKSGEVVETDSTETVMAGLSGLEVNQKCRSKMQHYIISCRNHHWMDRLSRRAFPADKERLVENRLIFSKRGLVTGIVVKLPKSYPGVAPYISVYFI